MFSSTRNHPRLAWIGASLLALAALVLGPARAPADFTDPATLHIGGTVPTNGGDPNLIGSSGLVNIYQNQGSTGNLNTPILLIIGVVNDQSGGTFFGTGTPNPITSVTSTNPSDTGTPTTVGNSGQLGGQLLYGGTWNTTTGYVGSLTSATAGDVYSMLGNNLQGPTDNSNKFGTWAGADLTDNGITATNFGIYVFEITAPLAGQGVVSVQFASNLLPQGSYAIAYGLSSSDQKVYDTPFTEAGLTTGGGVIVPAPPSIVLLGLGGLFLTGFLVVSRRRAALASLAA